MKKLIFTVVALAGAVGLAGEIKLGIVGIDTSHAIEFTKHINVEKDREIFKDFRIVAAYKYGSKSIHSSTNRYPRYEAELKGMGVEMVPSVKDVLAKCDAVLLETNDGREHLRQAREIFASGKPVFIDKPIAHNYFDALQILREARARKAKFFSCSALRWTEKVQAARNGKVGEVRGVTYAAPSPLERTHSRFAWYGIHGFEPLVTVLGTGAESVGCVSTENEDLVTVKWRDGRLASLRLMRGAGMWNYTGQAFTTEKGVTDLGGYEGYAPMLEEILKFFKTGVVPYPPEETEEIFCIMAAAELSGKQGGRIVKLDEIREKAASAQRAPGDVRARDLTPLKDFKPGKGPSAIVAKGRFPQMTIVAEGSREGRFAAPFLAAAIEEMTGAKLKVVYENPAKPVTNAPAIYIGDTEATRRAGLVADAREEWGPEAHRFRVVVKDGSIYLCGNRCDYATVDFAERVLGVRQYWPAKEDGRAVVKTEGLAVPPMEYSDAPVFAHRDLWPYEGADWCRVWKVGNSHRGCHHVHAPARWHVDTNLNYKATRPEIFALTDDGKRATMPLLCYGNPRTLETYTERILAEIASGKDRGDITDPRSKTITVSQWDIQVFCNCEYCQAILKKNPKASEESVPSFSNVLWGHFTKELAKWAKKELPDWKISILPYHNTTAIPDGVDFIEEGNVETYLCTMPGLAMLKDATVKQREEKLIRDWARITGRPVQNWHYIIWPAETCPLPYLFGKTIQRHYRDTRDVTVGSFLNGRYPVDRLVLSAYCWLRLLWNPETSVDAIYDTFATRMFGPASRQMREIVRMQEAGWERPWKTPRLNNRNFYEVSFPRADVQKIEALFAEAEKLAADDAVVTNRIAWYKKGFKQMFAESAEYAAGCAFAPLLMQKVAQDPVIDGKLDEACWKTAEAQEFCEAHKEGSTPQKERTSIRAVWTPKGVTFGIDCHEHDMANLCDDGPTGNYWANDCVECLVDLGGDYGAFGRVMVDASGKCEWYDGFQKAEGPEGVKCVVAKNAQSWSIELYVPYAAMFKVYKDFEHPTTSGGMNWSGNFIRLHRGDKLSTPVGKRGPKGTETTRLHTRGKGRNSDPAAFTKFIFREN